MRAIIKFSNFSGLKINLSKSIIFPLTEATTTFADDFGFNWQSSKANVKNQTEKILSTFEHLKQFLEEEKQQLLSRLEKEQEENMKKMKRKLTQLERDQSSHIDLITELERKCQQQDVELLTDVKSVLVRIDSKPILTKYTMHEQAYQSHKLRKSISDEDSSVVGPFHNRAQSQKEEARHLSPGVTLQCAHAKFLTPYEDAVGMGHCPQRVGSHTYLQDKLLELKGEVTLDPDTAHPWLILSGDGRSVSLGDHKQDLPDTLQRFTKYVMALGRERLTSGRHYWEVEVGGKTAWDLGACDESVSRNGELTLSPEGGLWVVRLMNGKYWALTCSRTPLNLQAKPRVLGLFLDYEAGRLSVYDAQDRALLFTFSGAPFACTLRPLFGPQLNTGGMNSGALRILTGTGQD
ncbi:E3 ubiquitin-protein ligase TRIM39-like [Ambystoma mexicanum]|uniref:E3 ubiquitin-protein ligase TRIM39-like n=1 Tax=Ambystoma mexicanum TaxID=8296 RepID=UPI0037E8EF4C